ncbi:hypothetical protein V1514DRAFT_332973 [Lipomyces japonicus]|uniref:uncharacterized protein n=1 Tax=Lipomyces japonicus TaxID=56871 RepID=UPI0034CD108F
MSSTASTKGKSDQAGTSRQRRNGNHHHRRPRRAQQVLLADNAVEPVAGQVKVTESSRAVAKLEAEAAGSAADATAEVCFICAEPVKYSAVSPCNHRSCHVCALRMRALYNTNACVHCRTNQDKIIFTIDHAKRYEDYIPADIVSTNGKLGIDFDSIQIEADTKRLLEFNCPDRKCQYVSTTGGWADLRRHVKEVHHKVMCQLCTRNKKVFTHEHKLYTQKALARHERVGDEEGFSGHPECQFCKVRYYSADELRVHYRESHERCHICDRHLTGNSEPSYFLNYDALEQHFRRAHFLCPAMSCLEQKFVVFENEIDLKAHQVKEHANIYGKGKAARTIDVEFRGRQVGGYDGRVFGSQLSAGFPTQTSRTTTATTTATSNHNSNSNYNNSIPAAANSNSELNLYRHQRLDERAAQLLTRDSDKYRVFRALNTDFRKSAITAKELVAGYGDLFEDVTHGEIGEIAILIHELAELFADQPARMNELRTAWNNWRTLREDFPDFSGATNGNGGSGNNNSSNRSGNTTSRQAKGKGPMRSTVWSGGSSSPASRLDSGDLPSFAALKISAKPVGRPQSSSSASSLASVAARVNGNGGSLPRSTSVFSPQNASSNNVSTSYANTWVPSTATSASMSTADQKIQFASRPINSGSSSSSSSSLSSSSAKLKYNLNEFPPLPSKKKLNPALRGPPPAPVSGWASAATQAPPPRPRDEIEVKKGKKGTVVFRLG